MMRKILMSLFIFALAAASLFAAMGSAGGEVPATLSCAISPSSVSTPVATAVSLSVSCYSSGNEFACPQMGWSSTIGSFNTKSASPVNFNSGTAAGTGTITASSADASGSALSCSIPATVSPGAPFSLKISPKTISLSTGASQQFSAMLYDQYGNQIYATDSSRQIVWAASENIGKVSPSGLFSALVAGKGTVSAAYSQSSQTKISDSAEVSVSGATKKSCVLSVQNSKITVTQATQVNAKCYDSSGPEASAVPREVTCPSIIWSASEGSIVPSVSGEAQTATFTSGKTAKQVAIMASEDSPLTCAGCTMSCSATVNVIAGAPASLTISPSSTTLYVGGFQTFTASASDQFGNAIPSAQFSWSSAGGVGSVDSSGRFTASSSGSGTVKASLAGAADSTTSASGLTASASVSVSQQQSGGNSGSSGNTGGSSSGGGSFASSSTVSFTCAGKQATVLTRIYRPNATALVEIFHMETTPSTKVFSSNVSNNQNASFTPANSGDYSLHVTVGTDQRNADFYVPQCTPSTVNVTKNVTIEFAPPITPKNQTLPPKTQSGSQTGKNEVAAAGSVAQQEGAIFGLPLTWVLVAVGVLLIVAAYFLLAGKKAE